MLIRSAFFSLLLACGSASAFPVTWTLSGVTFVDGGTASGSFVYDADSNNVLDTFSISVAGGDTSSFPPITYDSSNSTGGAGSSGASFTINEPQGFPRRDISIQALGALTDAGGTLAVNTATLFAGECVVFHICFPQRYFAGGSLVGAAAPVFASAASATADLSTPITFVVHATGAPVPSLALTGALPANVMFVDNGDGTGSFSGTAIETGSYPVIIVASNGIAPDATQAFTLTVSPPAPLLPVPALGGWGLLACALLLLLVARRRIARRPGSISL